MHDTGIFHRYHIECEDTIVHIFIANVFIEWTCVSFIDIDDCFKECITFIDTRYCCGDCIDSACCFNLEWETSIFFKDNKWRSVIVDDSCSWESKVIELCSYWSICRASLIVTYACIWQNSILSKTCSDNWCRSETLSWSSGCCRDKIYWSSFGTQSEIICSSKRKWIGK